jgi:hypothetical protein
LQLKAIFVMEPQFACPSSPNGDGAYLKMFQDWIQKLRDALPTAIPKLPELSKSAFCASCCAVQASNQNRLSAFAVKDALTKLKDPPATAQELADADKAIAAATAAQDSATTVCQSIAAASLLPNLEQQFLTADYDDSDLVTYTVLSHGTAQGLADWCESSPELAEQLMTALNDTDLLRLFLQSGGARNGKYGPAVNAFRRLMQSPNCANNTFLRDLALATSLELADPYDLFNQRGKTDIILRYTHYEQAYLLGELDPNFATLNVWELRQVVNSDATEDELGWGRRSLEAYRPDICLWPDEQWSYCEVVRTDVAYKNPEYVFFFLIAICRTCYCKKSIRKSLTMISFLPRLQLLQRAEKLRSDSVGRWRVWTARLVRCFGKTPIHVIVVFRLFLLSSHSRSQTKKCNVLVVTGTAVSFARRLAYPRGGCARKATPPCLAGHRTMVGLHALVLALPGPGGTTREAWTFCSKRRPALRAVRSRIMRNRSCASNGRPPFTRRTSRRFGEMVFRTTSRRGILSV